MLDSQLAMIVAVRDGLADRFQGYLAHLSAGERESGAMRALEKCMDCFRRGVPLTQDLQEFSDRARERLQLVKSGQISLGEFGRMATMSPL